MNQGDIIYIRNSAGRLKLHLDQKLNLRDVFQGMGADRLPIMERPRLEFHERGTATLVSLFDQDKADDLPATMYLGIIDYGLGEAWKCHFDTAEEDEMVFETIKYE